MENKSVAGELDFATARLPLFHCESGPRLGVGTPADVEDAALPCGSQQLLSQQRRETKL